jgi:hypothetical protein
VAFVSPAGPAAVTGRSPLARCQPQASSALAEGVRAPRGPGASRQDTDPVNVRYRAYGAIVHESPGRYDVIIRVARDGGQLPDPVTFAVAADQAASRRSASIISVHLADTIINVVTVTAPERSAALAVARAVVSDALKLQAPSPTQ